MQGSDIGTASQDSECNSVHLGPTALAFHSREVVSQLCDLEKSMIPLFASSLCSVYYFPSSLLSKQLFVIIIPTRDAF